MANGVFRVCGAQGRGKLAVQLLLLGAQSAREMDYLWPGVPSYRLAMEAVRGGGGGRGRDGRGGERSRALYARYSLRYISQTNGGNGVFTLDGLMCIHA